MKALNFILLFFWLLLCSHSGENSLTLKTWNSHILRSSASTEDTLKVNEIVRRGLKFISTKDPDLAKVKQCIDSAYILSDKLKVGIPALLNLLNANYLYLTGDYRQSEEEALRGLESARNNGEFQIMARMMLFLGRYYLKTGFFKESDDYFSNSIELARKKDIKGIITRAYQGQADIYETVKDHKSFRKSLELMADAGFKEKDTIGVLTALYRLGTALSDTARLRDFHDADSLLRKVIIIGKLYGDSTFLSGASSNLGWNFYCEKMYDSSIVNYKKAIAYGSMSSRKMSLANPLGNLGTIYRDLKNTQAALSFYTKALDYATKDNDWYTLSWVYNDMSNMYLVENDTSNAFKAYILYKKYNDQLIYSNNSAGLTEARIRYEADSHRKEVELLSLKLYNQRLIIYGFCLFLILVFLIGWLILRASRHKARRRISDMKRQIAEITQANLRQQMNPHFVFNTLNSIQYYMYQHDKLATNNYLTKFSNLMRKVLENSQHTSVTLNDELTALNLYLELESLRFKDRFDYSVKIDEEIDPLMYKVPTMIIQPYVENSINHGLMPKEGKGFVMIDIRLEKEFILCTIEDNGIGREAANEIKENKGTNHNSLGTQITNSRLDLVNSLYGSNLKTVYTDLKNEKGEACGTRVEIHLPIMI